MTGFCHDKGGEMLSRIFVRQALGALVAIIFLLICSSGRALAQSQPETQELISFKDAPLKTSIYTLATLAGLNVVIDESVEDRELITIELWDVSFQKALELILVMKKLDGGEIAEKMVIIFPDNEANRHKYRECKLWSVSRYSGSVD
jgi:type II secretory pathway component GspD/PulD (secretin)